MDRTRLLRLACLLASTGAVFAVAGCGGTASSAPSGNVVQVTERDFAISLSPKRVAAGPVVFHVANRGPDRHEFIVVRVPKGGLPLRTDGMTINEEKLLPETPGGLEPAESGALRDLSVTLRPGEYEVFCNMSGHFMAGMHTMLVVT
jgi:uncharacterized cupredoxin-like copper-binding protein